MMLIRMMFLLVVTGFSCTRGEEQPQAGIPVSDLEPPVISIPDRTELAIVHKTRGLLWKKRFDSPIMMDRNNRVVEIIDLEGDGSFEVLAATDRYDARNKGYFFCLNQHGEIAWSLKMESEDFQVPYFRCPTPNFGPNYLLMPQISKLHTADLEGDGTTEVMLMIRAADSFFPMMLLILDSKGRPLGIIWAQVRYLATLKRPGTDLNDIVAVGDNTRFMTIQDRRDEKKRIGFYVFLLKCDSLLQNGHTLVAKAPDRNDFTVPESFEWYQALATHRLEDTRIEERIEVVEDGNGRQLIRITMRNGVVYSLDRDGEITSIEFVEMLKPKLKDRGIDGTDLSNQLRKECIRLPF